jgi:hypothetical protein
MPNQSKLTHRYSTLPAAHPAVMRIERALQRYHTLLRLIELGAPSIVVANSERLVAKSLKETGLAEVDLARRYPTFRLAVMGREASEVEPD